MFCFIRFLIILVIMVISLSAQTDRKKKGELIRKYCQNDREEFCKNVKYGSIIKCLKSHKDEISPNCKSILMGKESSVKSDPKKNEDYQKERGENIRKNCKNDKEKFCSNINYGSIILCLKRNLKDISSECRESLKRKK
ncbi:MAG: hypothetical protein H7A23_07275 [Leptospiraceae bacterium]|nr:hypothetical protein [Leptospiraceae bacterium]MCP5494341.1 hypothetical protein [Leptospiraceae bacterium]